jgi:hypothetical protein
MLRHASALILLAGGLAQPTPAPRELNARQLSVTTSHGDHVALAVVIRDRRTAGGAAAAALSVQINGREAQHILVLPGSGREAYDALLGPFGAGEHEITLERSTLWPWPDGVEIGSAHAEVRKTAGGDAAILAHAPSLGLRADTIGTASDLPLLIYVEDQRHDAKGWIRYSAIFSHEDGGTPAQALMARWGRTTDIELVYEVDWSQGQILQERFQGPDHKMLPFHGRREGQHPYLLVSTLNNMFLDRGMSLVTIRPVPRLVRLEGRTRESVMDDHPWIYGVMARELQTERRIDAEVEDPRSFLYVEAELDLRNAAVSALARSDRGDWRDSSRGREDFAIARNGCVRIAIPSAADATALRWQCHPRASEVKDAKAQCRVQWTRAFRLDTNFVPGENLIEPGVASLTSGLSEPVRVRQRE